MRILHIRPEGHRESHNLSNLSQTFINAYKFYFVLVHDESSIVVEGIRTFFFKKDILTINHTNKTN